MAKKIHGICETCRLPYEGHGLKYCSYACRKPARLGSPQSNETREQIRNSLRGRPGVNGGSNHYHWNPNRLYMRDRAEMYRVCLYILHRVFAGKSETSLDYTQTELMSHLESSFLPGMSWNNYGRGFGKWSIDHTIPVSRFELGTDLKIVNALSNLKPMWFVENSRKGNRF